MELTIEQALRQGVAAHKEGKLQEAERLYRVILQYQPKHLNANHNLGVLAVSLNKVEAALPLFKTALETNPKIEQFWVSYIHALIKKKQFDNAKQVFEQAKKHGVDGNTLNSIEIQLSTKSLKPNIVEASPPQELINTLLEHYQNGRFSDAEKFSLAITQDFPKHQFAWKVLGAVLVATGRIYEAVHANETAVVLSSQDAEAHFNLGITFQELGRLDKAEASYTEAIALKPDYADAYNNLGNTFEKLGRLDEAEVSYNHAIALKPDYAEAYSNLGNTLQELGRLDEAEASYNQAIALRPDYADAYNNLGNTLEELGRLDEAEASYTQAIALKPNHASAHNNMGNALQVKGKLDEAIEIYKKSTLLKSDYADAHVNLSYALLNSGRLREGFDEYEWRWKKNDFLSQKRHFSQLMWDGKQSLTGKKILLWCEQGVGDTLMWSSSLPLVTSRAKQCILECQEKLVPLLKRSFPNVEVKAENRSLDLQRDDFDYHLPMGSLYKNFIQELSKPDITGAYLLPDPVRVDYWKDRLKSIGKGPFIGLGWKSANMSPRRLQNYATISELSPVLKIPNVIFINLQYSDFAEDLSKVQDELGVTVYNFDDLDHFKNIDDVAALCSALDLVVSTQSIIPLISAGVGTSTKLASWKFSTWNNILHKPVGPLINKFERNTWEPWEKVFKLIFKDILQTTKNWN